MRLGTGCEWGHVRAVSATVMVQVGKRGNGTRPPPSSHEAGSVENTVDLHSLTNSSPKNSGHSGSKKAPSKNLAAGAKNTGPLDDAETALREAFAARGMTEIPEEFRPIAAELVRCAGWLSAVPIGFLGAANESLRERRRARRVTLSSYFSLIAYQSGVSIQLVRALPAPRVGKNPSTCDSSRSDWTARQSSYP